MKDFHSALQEASSPPRLSPAGQHMSFSGPGGASREQQSLLNTSGDASGVDRSRLRELAIFVLKSAVAVMASLASVALTIGIWRVAPAIAQHNAEGASLIEVVSGRDGRVVEALQPLDLVHRQGRPHKGVWVFVVNAAGQMLLLRRSAHMMTCPNTWSIVGEHNQPGESYLQAGRRGVAEELGWSVEQVARMPLSLLGAPIFFEHSYANIARTDRQHSAYALLRLPKGEGTPPMAPDREESTAKRWVPLARMAAEVKRGGAQARSTAPC